MSKMNNLAIELAEKYMQLHPGMTFEEAMSHITLFLRSVVLDDLRHSEKEK